MNSNTKASSVSTIIETFSSLKNAKALVEKKKSPEFSIKIANTLNERQAVFSLAYQVYLKKDFVKKNEKEWYIQSYDSDPSTIILMVEDHQKNLIGSVSLVFGENLKLPAEKIYDEKIRELRSTGAHLVEISRLVINSNYRSAKEVLLLLFNYLAIYSYHIKRCTGIVAEVNPRHKNYYKALLNFEEIGSGKSCPSVQNAPAVLLYLPLSHYHYEKNRLALLKLPNKKERSLYPYALKPEQESLVVYYLRNQVKPMTMEEKVYFGFSNSGFHHAVCV